MTSASSTIIGMEPAGKQPGDSDVRLVPDSPKSASDSDVRLSPVGSGPRPPSDSDVTLASDEFTVGSSDDAIPAGGPGDTSVGASPVPGSSGEVRIDDVDDSDFELSPVIDALQPDSGSDFELAALDASDEFEATPLTKPSDSDVTGALPAESGINLAKPSDSGINLQGFGGLDLDDSQSLELAPLDEEPARPAARPAAPPSKPKPDLAATALPSKQEKDIFEDTDFEVDALDTGQDDRTIQLEAASDFDVDDSDSASEVFAIDEEDVDQNAATSLAQAVEEDEEEDSDAFEASTEDLGAEEAGDSWDVEGDVAPATARGAAAGQVVAAAAPAAEWGGIWVGLLGVATLFMMLLAFVAMDVVQNMYDYRGSTFSSGLVNQIAGLFNG